MASQTAIEWTDATFNPWIGCTKVSPGCDNCYAAAQDKFRRWTPEGWGGPRRRTSEANWRAPIAWNAKQFYECLDCGRRFAPSMKGKGSFVSCPGCGKHEGRMVDEGDAARVKEVRRRVFCSSLADVFDNQVPAEWRRDLFSVIELTPDLDWLLLTKRIGNVADMVREARSWDWMLGRRNVWLGATVVNQEEADRDVPKLLATPARVRFLSMEPLLGPVDLRRVVLKQAEHPERGQPPVSVNALHGWHGGAGDPARLHWVIVGGESGPGARPMHAEWARSLRDQCAAAGMPFLFKQWGEWTPGENVERVRGTVDTAFLWNGEWSIHPLNLATDHGHIDDQPDLYRIGKKAAGRLLDGVEHNGFPEVS